MNGLTFAQIAAAAKLISTEKKDSYLKKVVNILDERCGFEFGAQRAYSHLSDEKLASLEVAGAKNAARCSERRLVKVVAKQAEVCYEQTIRGLWPTKEEQSKALYY